MKKKINKSVELVLTSSLKNFKLQPRAESFICNLSVDFLNQFLNSAAEFELGIHFVGVCRMKSLAVNSGKGKTATDVLSFPVNRPPDGYTGPIPLGDIVICPAKTLPGKINILKLIVHGLLHLTGNHHETERELRLRNSQAESFLDDYLAGVPDWDQQI